MLTRLVFAVGFAAALAASTAGALAQGRGRAGDFDYWLLSLSWSPSWCELAGDARRDAQCARPFAFVVHGLWPQNEHGFPSGCITTEPEPPADVVRSMLDIMPSAGLVRHEWTVHGACSGLGADAYFRVIRRLFEKIRIPEDYARLDQPRMTSPRDVEAAFVAANPGLDRDEISITCGGRRIQEVRLCLKKDLSAFRSCPDVERRSCRLDRAVMPAVRTGAR